MRRQNVLVVVGVFAFVTGCRSNAAREEAAPTSAVAATATAAPVAPEPTPIGLASAAAPPPAATTAVPSEARRAAGAPMAKADRAGKMARESGGEWDGLGMSDHKAMPAPQFAGVKAGEWDDNANYREFQKLLTGSQLGFHRMDLRDRRFLVVRDGSGKAIPRCHVTVSDGQQRSVAYTTTASGRAILFPHAESLGSGKLVASARCDEGTTTQTFAIGDQEADGVVDLRIEGARKAMATKTIDVAFVLDTTGSMAEEISAVKATIQKVARSLSNDQTSVRIGLVEYKDRSDPFVTKAYPFSSDLNGFSQKVSQIEAGGGGDIPEDMNAGLHAALTGLQWNEGAVAKLAFVIGDAPPHLDYQDGPDYANDTKVASHRGIQLFTVAASGMDGLGQIVFRQMAQYTGGTNMFVLRGGAGPQSTGGGDPASSCGGTHTNYSSGKLDELIVQKIRHELRAVDGDPMRIAGLRQDENAKPCDQRIVFAD